MAQWRHIIGQFFHKNSEHVISYTVKHFLAFGIARSTIYSIISTLKKRGNLNRKFGSGSKSVKKLKSVVTLLETYYITQTVWITLELSAIVSVSSHDCENEYFSDYRQRDTW